MKNSKMRVLIKTIIVMLMILIFISPNQVKAYIPDQAGGQSFIVNPNDFDPNGKLTGNDVNTVTNMVRPVVNVIAVIGTVASVITLMIMGLKYMMGSIEEKAEYKKTMIPYLIGVVILFGISGFLTLILKMTEQALS